MLIVICCLFFFKQKTAYEMRISDWSSDVCSSDLEESLGPIAQEHLEEPMIRLAVPPMLRLAAVAIVFCMAGTAARAETEAEALVTEARLTVDRLMADRKSVV